MRWNFLSNVVLVKILRPQRNPVLDDSEAIQYLQSWVHEFRFEGYPELERPPPVKKDAAVKSHPST